MMINKKNNPEFNPHWSLTPAGNLCITLIIIACQKFIRKPYSIK